MDSKIISNSEYISNEYTYSEYTSNDDKIFIITTNLKNNENKYYNILCNIIEKYNLEHSTNKNGIFLNLSILDSYIIDEIYTYFINNDKIVVEEKIVPGEIKKHDKINNYEKDKLILEKFDKFLLQKSRSNISI